MFKIQIRRHVTINRQLVRPLLQRRLVSDSFFNRNLKPLFGALSGKIEPSTGHARIKIDPIVRVPSVFDHYERFRPKQGFKRNLAIIDESIVSESRFNYRTSIRQRPDVGSLVEVQKNDGSVHLGIVISKQQGLFHEDLSELSMINTDGETIKLKVEDVTFHLFNFMDQSSMKQPMSFQTIGSITDLLRYFVNLSLITRHNTIDLYEPIQAWFAKKDSSVQIEIEEIAKFTQKYNTMTTDEFLRYEISLFAAHLQLSKDPVNWMVVKGKDNHHLDGSISKSLAQVEYFSNSLHTSESLEVAIQLNDETLERIGEYLKAKVDEDDLSPNDYNELKPYIEAVLKLMKHFILYPHSLLKERLIPVMSTFASTASNFGTREVHAALEDLEEHIGSIDIFETIESRSSLILPQSDIAETTYDYFQYMREPFDKLAFGIPSVSNNDISDLAVSLEKLNTSWILNIHVLDVGSHISPKSKIVELLKETVSTLSLSRNKKIEFIPDNVLETLVFHDGNSGNNAITFGIEFPLSSSNGWEDAKLISMGLTRLNDFRFTSLDEINNIIDSKMDFWGIFKSKRDGNTVTLGQEDKSILSSIFRLIEQWQISRNNKHSLEFTFPYKKCIEQEDESLELVSKTPLEIDFLKFIRTELGYMLSEFLSTHQDGKIPLIKHSQEVLSPLNDSIEVESQKFSIPNYQGLKYEHFTLFPNVRGEIPLKKFICGSQFLNHDTVSTFDNENPHFKHGLGSGLVNLIDPLNNFEDLVNQWQVIMYLKKQLQAAEGYNFHLNQHLIDFKLLNPHELSKMYKYEIQPVLQHNRQIEYWNDRYWKLQWLEEQRLREEWLIFQCTVTSPLNPGTNLCNAYCFDLDLQVEILVTRNDEAVEKSNDVNVGIDDNAVEINNSDYVQIGDQLMCTKIIELDYIESRLILSI